MEVKKHGALLKYIGIIAVRRLTKINYDKGEGELIKWDI